MNSQPYGYGISRAEVLISPSAHHIERRLSDLQSQFADQSACLALLEAGNPLLYEVYEHRRPEIAGELLSGLSIVHPGRVGDEFYMTKGHYHSVRATAEIYYCLEGRGLLVMENEYGETAMEEFVPGRVVYVTPGWAHRSVNTGREDLVTFFVYPGNAGHDYEAIASTGFRKRIVDRHGEVASVDNAHDTVLP